MGTQVSSIPRLTTDAGDIVTGTFVDARIPSLDLLTGFPADDPIAATAGLRTLGGGAQQAAGGTHTHTLAQDVVGSEVCTIPSTDAYAPAYYLRSTVPAEGNLSLATKTQSYAALSMAVGVAFAHGRCQMGGRAKLEIVMGGVLVASSAYFPTTTVNLVIVGTRALSGSVACEARLHDYNVEIEQYDSYTQAIGHYIGGAVGIGSIEI